MIKDDRKVKFGIRPKLFLVVLIGFSALIIATSWRISVEANRAATATIERTLTQSSQILRTKIQSRFVSIQETATSLARDGRVLPLVYESASATLQDLTSEFQKALAFDVLFFTDSRGMVLARSDRPDAIGQVLAGKSSLFDDALHGQVAQGISISQGKLLQMVVAPIFDNVANDLVRGTVAIGYELSSEIAQEINALTASEIGFFSFERNSQGEIISARSSSNTNQSLIKGLNDYFENNPDMWRKIYESRESEIKFELPLEQNDFFAIAVPLANRDGGNLGFIMALTSRTELLMPFQIIQQQVFVVGFICILVAFLIAWMIAKRISTPIVNLVSVTKNIQEGNYPNKSQEKVSSDEVGLLYDAVFQMGNTLKEKAELENYLANISDGLDLERVELPDDIQDADLSIDRRAMDKTLRDGDITQLCDFEHIQDTLPAAKIKAKPTINDGVIIQERYQIVRHLGAGAMADVYLARDLDLSESVALKILDNNHFANEEIEGFKREIRLARRITHRNILRTYDFGVWEGLNYITMEFVQGYDLARLIDRAGPLSLNNGLTMAKQICSAMKAAHDQGIIHRDIKPSNMMINKQGIIKIMDFGLALAIGKDAKASSEADNKQTEIMIAGTPNYMAPEQFLGEQLDQRTDIYALGILLFTIFTGDPPFSYAKNYEALEELHLHTQPLSIRRKAASLPESLDKVVAKAVAKKPEDRYQSVDELIEALQAV